MFFALLANVGAINAGIDVLFVVSETTLLKKTVELRWCDVILMIFHRRSK